MNVKSIPSDEEKSTQSSLVSLSAFYLLLRVTVFCDIILMVKIAHRNMQLLSKLLF